MPEIDLVCVASWNVDLIAHVASPLLRGQTQMAHRFDRLPGGKGSNAAIAAARQGARVGLIARIGGDDMGRMGLDLWHREGIDARHVVQAPQEANGTALILVFDDGDNSIAVYPGAGAGLSAGHVLAAREMLAACRVVMASFEVPLDATLQAFSLARQMGRFTLLNPAPAPAGGLPDALWPLIDVLTPNAGELAALAGLDPSLTDAQSQALAAAALLARGVGAVIVTRGSKGCCLYRPGQAPLALLGHAVPVTDTIGAGDTFSGALAAAMSRGLDLPAAMRWANAAAALSVASHGAVTAMPKLAQVQALLNSGLSAPR